MKLHRIMAIESFFTITEIHYCSTMLKHIKLALFCHHTSSYHTLLAECSHRGSSYTQTLQLSKSLLCKQRSKHSMLRGQISV
jgi:hypothetical protein